MFYQLVLLQWSLCISADLILIILRNKAVPLKLLGLFVDSTSHGLSAVLSWLTVLALTGETSRSSETFNQRHVDSNLSSLNRYEWRIETFVLILVLITWRYRTIDANHIREVILSLTIGCSIDLDHFIAAGSPSLFAATHLSERPFGHNIVFVLFFSFGIFFLFSKRLSLLFVSASFNHLSRDAMRRGYTLCPWHLLHTTSIPYALYLGILVLLPLSLSSTLNKFPTFWNSSTGCCVRPCYMTSTSAKRTTCEEVWTWTKDPKLLFFVVRRHTLIRRFFHWDGHAGPAIFMYIFSHLIALKFPADYANVQQLCRGTNGRKDDRTGALIRRKLIEFYCHMYIKYYLLSLPISLDFIN